MNDLLFSLIFSFFFLVTSLLVVSMFYWPLYIQWIAFTKNCHEIFGNQPNFDKICFAIKENKWKYWIGIYFCGILNIFSFWLFLWIWTGDPNNNLYWIILLTFIFILSYVWLYFLIKKYVKEIKKIGIFSKEDAIDKFNDFKNEILKKIKEEINFEILKLKNGKQTIYIYNKTFQRFQKRYKRKIEKLLNKKQQHAYKPDIRLLNIFVKYLKRYSYGLKMINQQNNENIINLKICNKIYNIEKLPEILINNFFAFTKI